MENTIHSPVPIDQRPNEELAQLKKSYFFSWPTKNSIYFYRQILIFWFFSIPIFIFIFSGSYTLKYNIYKLLSISFIASTSIPFSILLRQILGWQYVYNRLLSEYITYEETDWHDGQTWEKPIIWKARERLIATEDVQPIIDKIRKSVIFLMIFILTMTISYVMFYS